MSDQSVLSLFHPVIQDWFRGRFAFPTDPQIVGWPSIAAGQYTLIAAPTGSGKTLTGFLAVMDRLLRKGIDEPLSPGIQVVYLSPLRALSNDMQRNLETPLREIREVAQADGLELPEIRAALRTGDTTSYQRAQIVKNPPQILVTTPESLYLMLTSARSREVLGHVNTVIVDEIHALVRDKRGSHLALSLERLEALSACPIQRIGLSATQKPIERVAEFLVGNPQRRSPTPDRKRKRKHSEPPCTIIDVGHTRELDLGIETPPSELQAVCSHDQWAEINDRLVELIQSHRSTLIFVNTRRLAERLTHQLTQLLGEDAVGSHHGSLSKDIRLKTEQQLKEGELKAVVATSSLELGIDVGYIDLVVQIGSPRAIAPFLQRIGRSGHALGLIPKGRLFALTRDELVECMALLRAVRGHRLDVVPIPEAPLDILAQQIVAEVAAQEWEADALFECFTNAWPYRGLTPERYEQTLEILSQGLTESGGRGRAQIYYDRINGRIRGRRSARLVALNNGGAIGETDTVRVIMEDENTVVGSVDEEFAVESNAGDIFLLGNTSWRVHRLRGNDLFVMDAQGAPPTIPFWQGEAPGRTIELSEEVSRLRVEVEQKLITAEQGSAELSSAGPHASVGGTEEPDGTRQECPAAWDGIIRWLQAETFCDEHAAFQTVQYMAAQRAAVGFLPTQDRILFERFFDESGGMQLVVHAPFGGRINRGWGLAFRKRFCRSFDFELQASADDDGFILSLGPQHSFPIETLFPMMRSDNARNLLEQALLVAPMFHLRWRWNVTRSLFVSRMQNGKKVPPALQRFRSEDALTAVFPKLTGCQENITGDHEIPDHPLVQQTMSDCLSEALDLEGLEAVLARVEAGEITLQGRDTREPSPFAYELLNANPYAFLDGGEVQERRARAVATRRTLSVEGLRDLGRLDPDAIDSVIAEAQPEIRDADELHDLLQTRYLVPLRTQDAEELHGRPTQLGTTFQSDNYLAFFQQLEADGRAVRLDFGTGRPGWAATERINVLLTIYPNAQLTSGQLLPDGLAARKTAAEALTALLRGWMETCGPVSAVELAELLALPVEKLWASLEAIEGEGLVLRGRFRHCSPETDSQSPEIEWCHRRLLARIHRRTLHGLRQEIEAVEPHVYLDFLAIHQGVLPGFHKQGPDGLFEIVSQLQGIDLSSGVWESHVLAGRVDGFRTEWLDELCQSGEVGWGRLAGQNRKSSNGRPMASMTRSIPISLFLREDLPWLTSRAPQAEEENLTETAQAVLDLLSCEGALFSADITAEAQLLPAHLDEALGELVAMGRITSDGMLGLRHLIRTQSGSSQQGLPARFRRERKRTQRSGRWTLLEAPESELTDDDVAEEWAWQLIRRWGVVFRDVAIRETLAPPWWKLLQVFRRLEARGELRGGRFIRGVSGEQFAPGDAVRELRRLRNEPSENVVVEISAADPLNLTGVVGTGARIPSLGTHRLAYRAGHLVAWKKGDENWFSPQLSEQEIESLRRRWKLRRPVTQSNGSRLVDQIEMVPATGEEESVPVTDSSNASVKQSSMQRRGDRKKAPTEQRNRSESSDSRSSQRKPRRGGIPRPFPF